MANKNGLLAPTATHGALSPSYYLSRYEPIVAPTLVAPVNLQSGGEEGTLAVPAEIFVPGPDHAVPAYAGAVRISPGSNEDAPSGAAGVVIRATGVSGEVATVMEVGTDGEGPNQLLIAGANGLSSVYDEKYNPVIKGTPVAQVVGALPGTWGVGLFSYTPDVSGAYMLQVNLNFTSAQAIAKPAAGFIEWTLTTEDGEVQYVSNTLASTVIEAASLITNVNGAAGGIADPVDYSFTDMCILTAGVPVAFNLFAGVAGAGAWAASLVQARLIKMC